MQKKMHTKMQKMPTQMNTQKAKNTQKCKKRYIVFNRFIAGLAGKRYCIGA
jgi:hypothetical protein